VTPTSENDSPTVLFILNEMLGKDLTLPFGEKFKKIYELRAFIPVAELKHSKGKYAYLKAGKHLTSLVSIQPI
jgi:hypothetical protein